MHSYEALWGPETPMQVLWQTVKMSHYEAALFAKTKFNQSSETEI